MSTIRPRYMAHVVYRTRRFEEMLRWYETVFGARVQHQNPVMAFLTFDDEHHRFAMVNMAALQPGGGESGKQGAVGVDHIGYSYSSLRDLLENYARLKAHGITPYWTIHHGVTVAMYYADPDGNQSEFQVDCFGTPSESHAFMNGPAITANPVGVEFDPEEWLAKLRAGTPEAELLATPQGAVSPIRGSIAQYVAAG